MHRDIAKKLHRSFPHTLHPASPIQHLTIHSTFVIIKEPTLVHHCCYTQTLGFPVISPCAIQDTTGHLVIMSPQCPLGCDNSSDSPSFRWPWQFWGLSAGRSHAECPSLWFSSRLDWGPEPQRWRAILITSYRGVMTSTELTPVDVDLDHLRSWLQSFSAVKLPFLPLDIVYSLEASSKCSRGRERSAPLKGEISTEINPRGVLHEQSCDIQERVSWSTTFRKRQVK